MSKLIDYKGIRENPRESSGNIKENQQDGTKNSEDLSDGIVMNLKHTISNSSFEFHNVLPLKFELGC